jgi:hypothetical protein
LDDALDKLARRDELRRRAAGDSPGTPPAVTELVEAIAGVISRHPNLNVTVGVEGAGDPTLLHFVFADGVVQVSADHTVAARAAEAPKHADFEIEVEEEPPPAPAYPSGSHDDQDRFGPTDFGYAEPPTAERPFVSSAPPVSPAYAPAGHGYPEASYGRQPGETTRDDLAARMRQANGATQEQPGVDPARPAPHPFAATPPPSVPPHNPHPYAAAPPPQSPHPYAAPPPPVPPAHTAPGPFAVPQPGPAPQSPPPAQPAEPQSGFPEPFAQPIPLQVERPEETEMAARRLAALLRDDPTLLDDPPA